MPINRQQLLDKLENVAPALAEHDLIPIMQHLLFTGDTVIANSDRIAISMPLKSNFKGTIPGKMLIDMLKIGAHAEEVDIKRADNNAQLIAPQMEVTFESRPVQEFSSIFDMPRLPREFTEVDDKFFTAIENCMQSVAEHAVLQDQLGITIIPAGRQAKLFSTNGKTMSFAKAEIVAEKRVILSAAFCKQMLRLKDAKKRRLALRRDHVLFSADSALLFGKYIQVETDPFPFEAALARFLANAKPVKPSEEERPRIKIALEVASRVCDIKGNEVRTQVKIRNKLMELRSTSERGRSLGHSIHLKHPDIDVQLQASFLRDVYDRYEDILITDKNAVMTRDDQNAVFVVSCFQR